MAIESALERQGWQLEKREKWTTVRDARAVFQSEFRSNRVGKLIGSKFFVTPEALQATAERNILALGLRLEKIASTSGRGTEYSGFESTGVADTTLLAFAEELHAEIQKRVQK